MRQLYNNILIEKNASYSDYGYSLILKILIDESTIVKVDLV